MNIEAGTIVRTLILLVALVNQMLSASGHAILPIADSDIETLITTIFTIVTAVLAWWKNNSFTKAARIGDAHMRKAREEAREDKNFPAGK